MLLYIALQERYAEILADTGIDGLVEKAVPGDGIIEATLLVSRARGSPDGKG